MERYPEPVSKQAALLLVPLALFATACGSSTSSATSTPSTPAGTTPAATAAPSSSVALSAKTIAGVGTVLVNGQGRTLYTFAPDNAKRVTCTGGCAAVWPPLTIAAGQKPSVAGGVNASLVSSDPNPSGGRVVTYGGWPLYVYTGDPTAGTDHGEGINSSGGLWYVIGPSGKVVKPTSGSSSSGSGAYSSGGSGY